MQNPVWYESLKKPLFTPQPELFAPAWIFLYGLTTLSLFVYIYKQTNKNKTLGYIFFTIQLLLNLSWSPVFFYFQNIKLSFVIIILLVLSIILTLIFFYKISKIAAALLVPYLLWTCFALYLNYGIMVLNL